MRAISRTSLPHGKAAHPQRRGTASVELALCLPVLLILTFGSVISANLIQQKQAQAVAAYEAALVATAIGGNSTDASQRANDILTQYQVTGSTVSINPAVDSTTVTGTPVTVTITAPTTGSQFLPGWFPFPASLTVTTYMVRL